MIHPAFTPQPQSINVLWPVLNSRPTEKRKLSWPGLTTVHLKIDHKNGGDCHIVLKGKGKGRILI